MKAYHGTTENFDRLDVGKTSEFGLYFADEKWAAECYGDNIHTVSLSFNNLCDLRTEDGLRIAINALPELAEIIKKEGDLDEMTISELIEYEFETCTYVIQLLSMNAGVNLKNGKSARCELLKAIKGKDYDSVALDDYTDGDEHSAYVIFDNANFKYI